MALVNGTTTMKHLGTDDDYKSFSSEKNDSRLGNDVQENGKPALNQVGTSGKHSGISSEKMDTGLRNNVQENGKHIMAQLTTEAKETEAYQVYPSRWIMLFIASSLNLSTSMNWITFAAAADTSVEFYKISTFQLNILSMCFVLASIPLGLPAAWITDTFGLRATFMIAAWSNGLGCLLRNISAMDIVPIGSKYSVVLIGMILIACGEKFVMMIPTKLAALWFPENRRALANMIGGITDAVGNMVAFIIVPVMVDVESDIPSMLWVMSAPAFLLVLATTFGVRRSVPPTPPSGSAAKISNSFFPGLKTLFKNKNYLILNLTFGAGLGIFVSHLVMLEQSLCPRGYSDEFAGLCGALMIVTGTVCSALASIYVDRTKKFDEVLKMCYGLGCLTLIAFTQVTRLRDQHVWVAIISALFGGFSLVLYPVCLELAVEVSFPVAAATSSGLCIISGSTFGIGIMFAMQFLARPLPAWEQKLESGCLQDGAFNPQDFTYDSLLLPFFRIVQYTSTYVYKIFHSYLWMSNCVAVAAFVTLFLFFRPEYKRLIEEKKVKPQTTVYVISKEMTENNCTQTTKL